MSSQLYLCSSLLSTLVVEPVAAESHRGWLMTRDEGPPLRDIFATDPKQGLAHLKDCDERGRRAFNPAEADIVRRIFREYAVGKGPLAIVRDLNCEAVPGPRGRHWNASALLGSPKRRNGILNNELYIGLIVYNRQRFLKDLATRKRISRENREREWHRQSATLEVIDFISHSREDCWPQPRVLQSRRTEPLPKRVEFDSKLAPYGFWRRRKIATIHPGSCGTWECRFSSWCGGRV